MERKIGEIFNYNGKWYQAIEQSGKFCKDCYFYSEDGCFVQTGIGWCRHYSRNDNKSIIYKKLEKVGEPFADYFPSDGIIYFQRYKCYQKPVYMGDLIYRPDDSFISIEIKNKEDMEEKKQKIDDLVGLYSSGKITYKELDKELKALYDKEESNGKNLKPFDLEAAKAGKPVCTRDGRPARIICFDRVDEYPILALVKNNGKENVYYYRNSGKDDEDFEKDYDLMMLPEK